MIDSNVILPKQKILFEQQCFEPCTQYLLAAVQCVSLVAPENGALSPEQVSYRVDQVVTFTCNPGFVRNGAEQVTCLMTGTWSRKVPTCEGMGKTDDGKTFGLIYMNKYIF